jgi:hypothetical protein
MTLLAPVSRSVGFHNQQVAEDGHYLPMQTDFPPGIPKLGERNPFVVGCEQVHYSAHSHGIVCRVAGRCMDRLLQQPKCKEFSVK